MRRAAARGRLRAWCRVPARHRLQRTFTVKEGAHVPKVTVAGGKVTILTPHPMTPPHFIVKHTLLTPEGKVIGEKTFTAADPKAESAYDLPAGFKGKLWATSFCNLHDLWLTELTV